MRLFGTGGEVLLYEEGKALGRDSSERLVEVLGRDAVVGRVDYLARVLTPEGWGVVSSKTTPEAKESRIAIDDCFECSGKGVVRKKCDFLRGFFEGAAEAAAGATPRVEESGCKLHGEKACTFRVIF